MHDYVEFVHLPAPPLSERLPKKFLKKKSYIRVRLTKNGFKKEKTTRKAKCPITGTGNNFMRKMP